MEPVSGRTILHVDQNAFFASVEQQANPELRGKPVAVIGRGRTVVTTASYEARAFGVKTGMTKWEAKRACPRIIFVVGNNAAYTRISTRIRDIFLDYTPQVETFSIDEAFLDVTGSLRLFGPPERIARLIKDRIRNDFGLTCSVGVAPNKLLAKLASEMEKPDGLTVIRPEDVAGVLETMPIEALCGIGRKTHRQLALLGIRTCGELGRFPVEMLRRRFGVIGERLVMMGQGRDDSPVIPDEEAEEVKSIGHSMTLDRDITDRQEILRYLLQLSEMVGRRARRYGMAGKTVHLTVRYADFTTFGRQQTLPQPTNASREIYDEAARILDTFVLEQPVRLLGVRITNLCCRGEQLPLFAGERRKALAMGAMDAVNDRYGDFSVTFGSLLDNEEKGSFVISPAWRPEGVRNVNVK
uniref:DNA polymerase IV n=1 Tax=Geobacter metallireducens TaxID=28232 RepID=A0A831UCJ8_GEOME